MGRPQAANWRPRGHFSFETDCRGPGQEANKEDVSSKSNSLRRIVRGSRQMRALGPGQSFSGIADTSGDLVLLDALPKTVTIDSTNSTGTAASGMSYTELAQELLGAGFALSNMASVPDISIAGACATGTYGSGDAQRVLAASVAGTGIAFVTRRSRDSVQRQRALLGCTADRSTS